MNVRVLPEATIVTIKLVYISFELNIVSMFSESFIWNEVLHDWVFFCDRIFILCRGNSWHLKRHFLSFTAVNGSEFVGWTAIPSLFCLLLGHLYPSSVKTVSSTKPTCITAGWNKRRQQWSSMKDPKESIAKAIRFREELVNPMCSTKYTECEYKGN